MANANPILAPKNGRSKNGEDLYRPCKEEEEEVDLQQYLTAVEALIYLFTTRPALESAPFSPTEIYTTRFARGGVFLRDVPAV